MANTTGKKFGGRSKGTPNKITTDMRKLMKNFALDNFDKFEKEWGKIKRPQDKAKIYLEACKFILPALQSVSFVDETDRSTTVEEKLKQLAEGIIIESKELEDK